MPAQQIIRPEVPLLFSILQCCSAARQLPPLYNNYFHFPQGTLLAII
jgi:hypothetical protein